MTIEYKIGDKVRIKSRDQFIFEPLTQLYQLKDSDFRIKANIIDNLFGQEKTITFIVRFDSKKYYVFDASRIMFPSEICENSQIKKEKFSFIDFTIDF